jgi:hypothetical protein
MNNSKQQTDVKTTANTAADTLSKKRRAFIKGSAAALPVVLTLRNGSAFAAQSISCLAQQQANQQDPNLPQPDVITKTINADHYIRTATVCRTITLQPNGASQVVYQYPAGANKWYPVGVNSSNPQYYVTVTGNGNGNGNGGQPLMVSVNTTSPTYKYAPGKDAAGFILVQLNPTTGIPTGVVGPNNTGQNAVFSTQSCMASLHP